jgi:hypothetical protein
MAAITTYAVVGNEALRSGSVDWSGAIDSMVFTNTTPPVGIYGRRGDVFVELVSTLPIGELAAPFPGWHATSFLDDYYYRVHVLPSRIDVGNLLSTQIRDVEVWNAWFDAQGLSSIDAAGATGLTLNGPAPTPTVFAPLESRRYELAINADGPPTLDAQFTFVFTADAPTLSVIGRRIVGWPIPIDWSDGVLERLEWSTDLMTAWSAKEQRVRLREHPRRSLEMTTIVGNNVERRLLENLMTAWQSRLYGVPIWPDAGLLEVDVPAGATVVPCDTATRDFEPGGLLALISDVDYEMAEIDTVSGDSVTMVLPLLSAWPAGSRVVPVRAARMTARQPLAYQSDAVATARIQWRLDGEWALDPAIEAGDYQGYPVLSSQTNWRDGQEAEWSRTVQEIDFTTGPVLVDDPSGFSIQSRTHAWLLGDRQETADFRAWLAARAGRLVPFWLASGQEDLEVVATIADTASSLTIVAQGYADYVAAAVGRRDVVIVAIDGQRFYRRITSAQPNGDGTETVVIDSPLGVTLTAAEIAMVSFLRFVRLAADAVEINHLSSEVAESSIALVGLRDDV